MSQLIVISKLLPKPARDKLIAAAKAGGPSTLQREIAINKAIEHVKADYPTFFKQGAPK